MLRYLILKRYHYHFISIILHVSPQDPPADPVLKADFQRLLHTEEKAVLGGSVMANKNPKGRAKRSTVGMFNGFLYGACTHKPNECI